MQSWQDIATALHAAGWIVYPMSALALAALVIILDRAYMFWRFGSIPLGADAQSIEAAVDALPRQHAARRLMQALGGHADRPYWWIQERAGAIAVQIQRDMSRGLWALETIVTAAPLLGLLGTILGMMHAFRLIGENGLVSPGGVTGGVAQALIATAIGLVIALAALFGFNYFSRRTDRLVEDLETCAGAWLAEVRLERGEPGHAS